MDKLLIPCLVVFGLVLAAPPALGQTTITPSFFALPGSAFPAPSTVIRSHVEPNRRIRADNVLHFGSSFAREGRITGYFMEAVEGRRASPRSDTSYLVSLFPTAQQTSDAFAEQTYYWDALAVHGQAGTVSLPDGAYGDGGEEALYTEQLPTGTMMAELLFQRGTIFVEVFQEVDAAHPSHAEVRAFFQIGTRLDIIARGVLATS